MSGFKCPVCASPYFGPIFENGQHVGRYCKGWPSSHDRSYVPCSGRHEERFSSDREIAALRKRAEEAEAEVARLRELLTVPASECTHQCRKCLRKYVANGADEDCPFCGHDGREPSAAIDAARKEET